MPLEKVDLIRAWLLKAQRDLAAARNDLKGQPPLTDSSVFHCQQAVEKTLKGFLLCNDKPFRNTHNLRELSGLVLEKEPSLETLLREASDLTPYAVIYRYPEDTGTVEEPTVDESERALALAQRVFDAVRAKLPQKAWPK